MVDQGEVCAALVCEYLFYEKKEKEEGYRITGQLKQKPHKRP